MDWDRESVTGSSPRERGKLEALARKNAEDRLIPA